MPPTSIPNGTVSIDTEHQVERILAAGKQIATQAGEIKVVSGTSFIIVPKDMEVKDLTPFILPVNRTNPARKVGTVRVHDIASFVAYFNAHKTPDSAIFVNLTEEDTVLFVGVINGHGKDAAGHGDFRVQYKCEQSVEWAKWMEKDGIAMGQLAFANHIEDCQNFIITPPGGELLKTIQNLEGKADVKFTQVQNLFNGKFKLAYEEDVKIGEVGERGEMAIPETLEVLISPFRNELPWKFKARVRVRLQNRQVTFVYQSIDTHLIIEQSVKDMHAKVAAATGLTPLLGEVN